MSWGGGVGEGITIQTRVIFCSTSIKVGGK